MAISTWHRRIRTPKECQPAVAALIDECLCMEAGARPTAAQVFLRLYATMQSPSVNTLSLE